MVVTIYEKRCGFYACICLRRMDYNEAPKAFFYITHEFQNPMTSKNLTLGGEKPKCHVDPYG